MDSAVPKAETAKPRVTAKQLSARYGLKSAHCLYRADGRWFHILKQFPGILFDRGGFVQFTDYGEYSSCPGIKLVPEYNHTVVKQGISELPGYTAFPQ